MRVIDLWKPRHNSLAPSPSWWRSNDQVWMVCPNGHAGQLDHEIAPDGTVTPSVQCPEDGCSFHDMVKLANWEIASDG